MNVSLVFDERRALTLPEDAIISEGDATYVFVLNGDAAERREIAIGGRAEGDVEVVEGIAAETQVVTSGYDALEDGALVRQREEQVGAEG